MIFRKLKVEDLTNILKVSAISIPVTIMLRGASIFPMSFIGARMTAVR